MTYRAEKKSQTRLDLIGAGLRLSGQKGFSALSIREVALEAGITPAGFYRHFHDMEELGLCMLDEVGLSLRQFLREARKKVGPGPDAIRISIDSFLKFINENQNLFRLLLGERQGGSAAFRRATHNEMDRFVSELTADLLRIHGFIQKPLENPALAAEAIVAVVFTLGAEALDLPSHKQQGLKERLAHHVEVILRGSLDRSAKSGQRKRKRTK
jgi:AcrR family transcriptional regulator